MSQPQPHLYIPWGVKENLVRLLSYFSVCEGFSSLPSTSICMFLSPCGLTTLIFLKDTSNIWYQYASFLHQIMLQRPAKRYAVQQFRVNTYSECFAVLLLEEIILKWEGNCNVNFRQKQTVVMKQFQAWLPVPVQLTSKHRGCPNKTKSPIRFQKAVNWQPLLSFFLTYEESYMFI